MIEQAEQNTEKTRLIMYNGRYKNRNAIKGMVDILQKGKRREKAGFGMAGAQNSLKKAK